MSGNSEAIKNHATFIWSVADLLRGDYKQSEYGKAVLPLTVLRRFDCVLAPVKEQTTWPCEPSAARSPFRTTSSRLAGDVRSAR